jgi:hypothetical protein
MTHSFDDDRAPRVCEAACVDMIRNVAKLARSAEWYLAPPQGRRLALCATLMARGDFESAMAVRDEIRAQLVSARTQAAIVIVQLGLYGALGIAALIVLVYIGRLVWSAETLQLLSTMLDRILSAGFAACGETRV